MIGQTQPARRRCIPCSESTGVLSDAEIERLHADLEHWEVKRGHHLARTFTFPDFAQALEFVNRIGAIAEEEGHHPDIHLAWGRVHVEIWTHKVDGLTESDFILAAKINEVCCNTEKQTRAASDTAPQQCATGACQ